MSPAGSIVLYVLAAIAALIATIFGVVMLRIASAVVLVVSLVLLTVTYPKYEAEMAIYKQHAHPNKVEGAKSATTIATP